MNKIIWTVKAIRNLERIDQRYLNAIRHKVEQLAAFPNVDLDVKMLKGQNRQYRLRVGNYRVIFEWIDSTPKIIEIKTVSKRSERTYN